MPNPALVTCTKDAYTKVATNVTAGQIHKIDSKAKYFQTYRLTGVGAPTSPTNDGELIPILDNAISIAAAAAIDVYILCRGNNGQVRVDV